MKSHQLYLKIPELKVMKPEVQYEGFNEGIDSNLRLYQALSFQH